ncbi:hypothetical protein BX659_1577, partial [Orenia metallireducens]
GPVLTGCSYLVWKDWNWALVLGIVIAGGCAAFTIPFIILLVDFYMDYKNVSGAFVYL